ncbi:MAG: hypothetical protein IJY94_06795 [Clostridia bacterium]|nr:hypothetical protein [Clostridia bacterium]
MSNDKINMLLDAVNDIRDKRASLSEKTLSYISELAEILTDEADEDEIFFRDEAFITRYRALTERKGEEKAASFNKRDVKTVEKQLSETEKAFLCLRLSDILGISGIEGSGTFFDDPPKASGETVCYVKSRGTDDAYISFASEMEDPRVSYAHDLTEVAQSVAYGKTAYGILPIASARAIMLKHGLKIAKRLKAQGSDGASTVYALVKKELDIPSSAENAFFEFTVKTDDPNAILIASYACSMKTVSVSYSAESASLNAVLSISEDGFCGFLTYLSLNYPDFVPIGIYKEL